LPEKQEEVLRRRTFWSGTVTFGLVSVPVALLPGNRTEKVSLRMLAPDGTPLQRRYVCPAEDRFVDREEIVRGYEVERGSFVVVSDEELESLAPEKSREIDLRRFVPREQLSPFYFDRSYFLVPTGDTRKPYRLLAETMERMGRAGVATFVMRSKEYLVAILAENGILRAVTLRFREELRSPEDVGLPEAEGVSKSDLSAMEEAVQEATLQELPREELKDEDADRLLALVRKKKASRRDVQPLPETAEEEREETGKVIDLMEVLKRSLEEKDSSSAPSGKKVGKRQNLSSKTKKELYEQAQKLDIPGRSDMDKDELVQAIREHG
jgi:DNA end-binding protein Ku